MARHGLTLSQDGATTPEMLSEAFPGPRDQKIKKKTDKNVNKSGFGIWRRPSRMCSRSTAAVI